MGRSYKRAILIGLALVLALSFVTVVVPSDVQASSPYGYGKYHGYMYKNMGKAYFNEPLPETIIRDSQDEQSCLKWYYQRYGHTYKRMDKPCQFGTAELDYERTYRRALRGVTWVVLPPVD